MKKNPILTGTIILTLTGFISRLIGFFYRIYLSQAVGAEGLGIYQLIFPIYSICFSICCGSIQTSISRNVAAKCQENPKDSGKSVFQTGLFLSFTLSVIIALLVHCNSTFLANKILMEPRCDSLLKILAWAIPFCSVTSCISGYYYGLKKAHIPAISQLSEQITRVLAFFLISKIWISQGMKIDVSLAVIVIVLGEAASALFSAITGSFQFASLPKALKRFGKDLIPNSRLLLAMAIPLTANRLCISLLQSGEAIMIPNKLQQFGLTNAQAFSVYGTLTGMSLPFILFPSAITNSIAVMLLPAMAEAQSAKNDKKINQTATMTIGFSLAMGILCTGLFLEFGRSLGTVVFKNEMAGVYIQILAWICPFMYITTTVGSMLNGLGKTTSTFVHNLIGLFIRIIFVVLLIPRLGILAYLWGMLASELLIMILHLFTMRRVSTIRFQSGKDLILPVLFLALSIGVSRCVRSLAGACLTASAPVLLLIGGLAFCITYCGFYYAFRLKDLL